MKIILKCSEIVYEKVIMVLIDFNIENYIIRNGVKMFMIDV